MTRPGGRVGVLLGAAALSLVIAAGLGASPLAAHAAEASRRDVPGTPWFFVKIGTAAPKVVRPTAYDGNAFKVILDEALGR
jgi:hypothetical protein